MAFFQYHICYQAFVFRQDDNVFYSLLFAECVFDLTQLNPVPPDLYLMVYSAQTLDFPSIDKSAQVTGFIHPCARNIREGIIHE